MVTRATCDLRNVIFQNPDKMTLEWKKANKSQEKSHRDKIIIIKGLNIHLVPILVVFIKFGHHFRFVLNYDIFVKFWSIWSFLLTMFK